MNSEVRPVLLSFDSMGVATPLREHILSSCIEITERNRGLANCLTAARKFR